ncbi:MAG: glutathione-disulfide reductase [Gammaproteobacteria bacterium]|nr:glutathione-disulfide reductase [Gammaproteobacteria bacterium]
MKLDSYDFDFFVIGAGSGGVRASRIAANLGARVAVAEERYYGGTCVNVGCVPKKLYSYAAHYKDDFEDSRGFGWESSDARFDWGVLKKNKDIEINRLRSAYHSLLEKSGVSIFESRARLVGPNEIQVGDKIFSARHILLAVGGWPYVPDFGGSEHAITSNEVFAMQSAPKSIAIWGGGYIAVEFASFFARLGVDTTLIYRGSKLLRGFDEDIRDIITEELAQGINLILENSIYEIINKNNRLELLLESGYRIEVEQIVAATGRRPLTQDLGLETTAVELDDKGAIKVDASFCTAEPSIYAVGDAINRVALTPVALMEGQWVAKCLFGKTADVVSYENIPTAVFCHPNVATCGYSEEQARSLGLAFDVYESRFRQLKHTLSGRQELSYIKLLVNLTDDRVIGAHFVAPDAGELMQGVAVAMNAGATKRIFDATLGIHPTLAEEFVTLREKRTS